MKPLPKVPNAADFIRDVGDNLLWLAIAFAVIYVVVTVRRLLPAKRTYFHDQDDQ